ncbi:MAG: signal protein, partial [Prevotella sp.]
MKINSQTSIKLGLLLLTLVSYMNVFAQTNIDSLSMDSIVHGIPEVLVKSEWPIAVVHGSAITYDLPRLIEKKGVDNIYDAIKELPGVIESNGQYQLAGRNVTIALNGQVMTLTPEQMLQLLKSLPTSRLEK